MISLSLLLTFYGTLFWYANSKYFPHDVLGWFKTLPMGKKGKNITGWVLVAISTLLLCKTFNAATGIVVSGFVVALGLCFWMLAKPFIKHSVIFVTIGFLIFATVEIILKNAC